MLYLAKILLRDQSSGNVIEDVMKDAKTVDVSASGVLRVELDNGKIKFIAPGSWTAGSMTPQEEEDGDGDQESTEAPEV